MPSVTTYNCYYIISGTLISLLLHVDPDTMPYFPASSS